MEPQKDGMDVLQAFVDEYNAATGASPPLQAGGEAGGAQLRLRYDTDGGASILHIVAVQRDGRPVMLVRRFDGALPDVAVQAGLWASSELGRR